MSSPLGSIAFVVLHAPPDVTFGEYLLRVVVSLLAFTGAGVTAYVGVRAIAVVHSRIFGRP